MLNNNTCMYAHRMRLGLDPFFSKQQRTCTCGSKLSSISHLLSCSMIKGGATIKRHEDVVHTLIKYIRKVGGTALHEPTKLDSNSGKRVDIDASRGYQRFLIVVQVINPTASSSIMPAETSLGAAIIAEKRKTSHHSYLGVPTLADIDPKSNVFFIPYIIESF